MSVFASVLSTVCWVAGVFLLAAGQYFAAASMFTASVVWVANGCLFAESEKGV